MKLNQAFELLKSAAGNPRDAKLVLENISHNWWSVWRAARQLRRGVPVSKIIGKKWFYGMEFETNQHTLCPRPDSEILVEAVVGAGLSRPRILDLGTGTGNLICAIVKNIPGATGVGIDISRRAIRVAKRNVKRHNLTDRIQIIRADFADNNFGCFDIIISNPPYIALGDERVDAGAMHDPAGALYAGTDGLDAYRTIAQTARRALRPGGKIYLEIGASHPLSPCGLQRDPASSVIEIFESAGWRHVATHKDLGGIERVLVFKK